MKPPILVVDDEVEILESLKALLAPEFEVHTARSGEDAMRVLHEVPVHIIMSDQRMPDMTGVELLAKARGECPEAVRLVFTGYADIKAVIEAINEGRVSRYITKPWDPDELISVLHQAEREYMAVEDREKLLAEIRDVLDKLLADLDGDAAARVQALLDRLDG